MAHTELEEKFKGIGLAEATAKTAVKNKKLTQELETIINEAEVATTGCPKQQGTLLYDCACKVSLKTSKLTRQGMASVFCHLS
ncbi:Glutaminyl-tRNA synthetase [Trebouxia sp. C0009 RCD-2024]